MKKKILHIITRLDTGGSAENAIMSCRSLPVEKYEAFLIYGLSNNKCDLNPSSTIEIKELVRNISPLKDIRAFIKIYKIIKRIKPDIVHTHSSKAGFIGRLAAKLAKAPSVVHTPHGHIFYGYGFGRLKTKFYIFLEKLASVFTSKIIALTNGEKNESLRFGIGKDNQWTIIHSGVEAWAGGNSHRAEVRNEFNIPEDAVIVGTVARLEHVKGVKYLIEAIPLITSPLFFLIIGDGDERGELELMVKNLRLRRVIFTGMRSDVPELMSAIDIYIQPSLNEGMGKTIVQAQYAGLPVIATQVQGIPDLIEHGKTGILVPPQDPRSIANAINELAQNTPLRAKLGLSAKDCANEIIDGYPRYSTQRMIYLLEQLYDNPFQCTESIIH